MSPFTPENARELGACRRPVGPRACEMCGTTIPSATSRRMYCSQSCRSKAYRARHQNGATRG